MRKGIGILVCLLVSWPLLAAGYQPMTYSAPETVFRSTSAYIERTPAAVDRPSGFLAISEANYRALNSENSGGPNRRTGRPSGTDYGGTGAIGNYDFHSPIGDIPWGMTVIFALLFAYKKVVPLHPDCETQFALRNLREI